MHDVNNLVNLFVRVLFVFSWFALGICTRPHNRYEIYELTKARSTFYFCGLAIFVIGAALSGWYLPIGPLIEPIEGYMPTILIFSPFEWWLSVFITMVGLSIAWWSVEKAH